MAAGEDQAVSSGYAEYVDGLAELLDAAHRESAKATVAAALDGGPARAFRTSVELDARRRAGAFFTGRELADRLLAGELPEPRPLIDPAAGAGDLLIAAARLLPVERSVPATLRAWGQQLQGRELAPVLVRATRLRLALLAGERLSKSVRADEDALMELLPEIAVGDGLTLDYQRPVTLLLNPPFGSVVDQKLDWGQGRLGRAAIFAARCLQALPAGSTLRAILPDVLRSGSNYARWRAHVEALLAGAQVEPYGQFDPWTDIDVFTLAAERADSYTPIAWWSQERATKQVDDLFEVRVGSVVPHRDSERGDRSPYICARDLTGATEYWAGQRQRQHKSPGFRAPFVAVPRTSRPGQGKARRLSPTIVRCPTRVLAENHLLICRPRDGSLRACHQLVKLLAGAEASSWLDQRIRCRHLTVSALRELPI